MLHVTVECSPVSVSGRGPIEYDLTSLMSGDQWMEDIPRGYQTCPWTKEYHEETTFGIDIEHIQLCTGGRGVEG